MSITENKRAIKKLEVAIDKLIGVHDLGLASEETIRALELLNSHVNRLRQTVRS